ARLLRLHLEASSYQVQHSDRGEAGLGAVEAFDPDVFILDVMLPDMDCFEMLRRIREHSSVPIIMLTSRGEERHKVQALMLGADDYVTKPFSAAELLARLTTILRRARQREQTSQQPIEVGDLTIDLAASRVYRHGQPRDRLLPGSRPAFSLSLWERAGVRVPYERERSCSYATLTRAARGLSQRERRMLLRQQRSDASGRGRKRRAGRLLRSRPPRRAGRAGLQVRARGTAR